MKKFKKTFVILLALAAVLALGTVAAAAETVENSTTHDYDAYRIFVGTQAAGDTAGKLAVTGWGDGIEGDAFLAALKGAPALGAVFSPATDAKSVSELLAANPQHADAFAALAHRYVSGTAVTIAAGSVSADLPAGYYLLVDTTDVTGTGDAKNVSLLQVTQNGHVTIAKKYGVPTVEKKVRDINDSFDTAATDWQDSADHDINDVVSFKLTGTLPSNFDDYETYFYKFNDTISAGLTYNGDAKVYLDNGGQRTDITADFDMTGAIGEIKCDNLKAVSGVTVDSEIVVEYTAVLNENAVIGSQGNPNQVNLEFSNNPNFGGEGEHGKTPDDTVIVFTYKVVVNKTNEQEQALTGAEFALIKKLQGGSEQEIAAVKNAEGTAFTFVGLDDGAYILRETKAPEGYNKIADVEFTVTAEHDILSDNPALTALTGTVTTGELAFASNVPEGSLNTDVVNKSGAVLPETGDIGTTVFYVLGAVLVTVAGILLISKKRMGASED